MLTHHAKLNCIMFPQSLTAAVCMRLAEGGPLGSMRMLLGLLPSAPGHSSQIWLQLAKRTLVDAT